MPPASTPKAPASIKILPLILLLLIGLTIFPSHSLGKTLIRDTEIEAILAEYANPLMQKAGLHEGSVEFILIGDPSLNAFVANGARLYIHTGLILAAEKPDMLIGVIAHELGHIKGGHLVRTNDALRRMQVTYGLATVLAAAAAAAGSGDLGAAAISAGGQFAQSQFFSYTQAQEQAADQAALSYLEQSRISSAGLLDILTLIRQKERLTPDSPASYLRTHPLTSDRMSHVRNHAAQTSMPRIAPDDPIHLQHDRMRAKLFGFLNKPQDTLVRYKGDNSVAGRLGTAIARFRNAEIDKALPIMDSLLKERPGDAYLHELKGQMLFENGRIKPAITAYGKARQLLQAQNMYAPLVTLDYARALLARNNAEDYPELETLLEQVTREDTQNMLAWKTLATVYDRQDKHGLNSLARAEAALLSGLYKDAKGLGERALKALPEGSPAHLRTQDLIALARKKQEEEDS